MNRRTLIRGIVAAPLLAQGVHAVAAQDSSPVADPNAVPEPSQLDGIVAAVTRTWGLNIEAELAGTPGSSPADYLESLTTLAAIVMKLESPDDAVAAHDAFAERIGGQLEMMGQGGTPSVDQAPLEDLGDEASTATLKTVTGDFTTWYRFVLVTRDEFFLVCSGLAGSEDEVLRTDDLARWMVDNGQEDGSEAIFVAEGGSTGGLWGFMPPKEIEVLSPLAPIFDQVLYPEPT